MPILTFSIRTSFIKFRQVPVRTRIHGLSFRLVRPHEGYNFQGLLIMMATSVRIAVYRLATGAWLGLGVALVPKLCQNRPQQYRTSISIGHLCYGIQVEPNF